VAASGARETDFIGKDAKKDPPSDTEGGAPAEESLDHIIRKDKKKDSPAEERFLASLGMTARREEDARLDHFIQKDDFNRRDHFIRKAPNLRLH
jgi:hypothetical protein